MTTSHTAGPWEFSGTDSLPVLHIYAPDGKHIFHQDRPLEEQEATAQVCAAAPDLLEALILLEHEMVESGNARSKDYGWTPAIEKTRAAIAKATGA